MKWNKIQLSRKKIQFYFILSKYFSKFKYNLWWTSAKEKKRAHLIKPSYLSSSLSFWQFPRKFPNWHEWICSWIWRRNASLNSKACGNCSVKCHTHSKNWVNTGETSFGSPSKWPHLTPPEKDKLLKMLLKEINCSGDVKVKHTSKKKSSKTLSLA